jgi:hypothetical protein
VFRDEIVTVLQGFELSAFGGDLSNYGLVVLLFAESLLCLQRQ